MTAHCFSRTLERYFAELRLTILSTKENIMPLSIDQIIAFLHTYPTWVLDLLMLLVCGCFQLFLLRFLGLAGLYLYVVVSLSCGNIQVLKASPFFFYDSPVALGTVVFTSLFLCTEIIREIYGARAARRSVFIGFIGHFMMTVFMVLTLGYQTVVETSTTLNFVAAHDHIKALFAPSFSIFVSSLIAYVVSQHVDIWIYGWIMKLTKGRFLWLRTNGASVISMFIDNCVFSYLAWIFFAPEPLAFSTVLHTYIFGVYIIRVLITVFNTPFMYLAKRIKPHESHDPIS